MKKLCIILSTIVIIAIITISLASLQNKNFNYKHYNSQQYSQEYRQHRKPHKNIPDHNINIFSIQNEVNAFIRSNNIEVDDSLTPYNSNCYSKINIKPKETNHNRVLKKCIKEARKLISFENKCCFESMFCYFYNSNFYILYK